MTQQRAKPTTPVLDPDSVQETLCDGRFHFYSHGNLATLTFTHNRPEPNDLFGGEINMEEIVRARITMTLANFVALRDLLNQLFKDLRFSSRHPPPVPLEEATRCTAGGRARLASDHMKTKATCVGKHARPAEPTTHSP